MVMLVSAILVDKITCKNQEMQSDIIGSEKADNPQQDKLQNLKKSQQYIPKKPNRTAHREGSILWSLQEAQDQTLDAAPPEESGNGEVKSCTGGLLQQEYRKAGNYY